MQLRQIANELKKVCHHPQLLPEFEVDATQEGQPGGEDGEPEGGLAAPKQEPGGDAMEVDGGGSGAAAAASELEALLAGSGKLALLDRMLEVLRARGQRVMVVSQVTAMLDILSTYASARFPPGAHERIDDTTPAVERFAAVARFRAGAHTSLDTAADAAAAGQPFLFLLATKSCGLGTDLPNVDVVVIFDSDWHPRLDVQVGVKLVGLQGV